MVLGFCAEADPTIKVWSEEEHTRRKRVLSVLCEEVPVAFAMEYARRYYRTPESNKRGIRGAEILEAWRKDRRVTEAKDRAAERADALVSSKVIPRGAPWWFRDMVTECAKLAAEMRLEGATHFERVVALDRVRAPVHVQSVPVGGRGSRERKCGTDPCMCTHTECFGGFLDGDLIRAGDTGVKSFAMKRCPMCDEARDMQATLNPPKKGRRR